MYTGYVSRPWQTLRSQYEAHECLVTASIGSVSIGHSAMPSCSDQAVSAVYQFGQVVPENHAAVVEVRGCHKIVGERGCLVCARLGCGVKCVMCGTGCGGT